METGEKKFRSASPDCEKKSGVRIVRPLEVTRPAITELLEEFDRLVLTHKNPEAGDFQPLYTGRSHIYRKQVRSFKDPINTVVLKTIGSGSDPHSGFFKLSCTEPDWLQKLQGSDKPVIFLYGFVLTPERVTMVLENCETNLKDYIISHYPDHEQILRIASQCTGAVSYAHENDLLVRDIKPENFLLACRNGQRRWILADLGMMSCNPPADNFKCGSSHYVAPEYLMIQDRKASLFTESWSMGITLMVGAKLIQREAQFPFYEVNGRTFNRYHTIRGFQKHCLMQRIGLGHQTLGNLIDFNPCNKKEYINCFDQRVPFPPLEVMLQRSPISQVAIIIAMLLRISPKHRMPVSQAARILIQCDEHRTRSHGEPQAFL